MNNEVVEVIGKKNFGGEMMPVKVQFQGTDNRTLVRSVKGPVRKGDRHSCSTRE